MTKVSNVHGAKKGEFSPSSTPSENSGVQKRKHKKKKKLIHGHYELIDILYR